MTQDLANHRERAGRMQKFFNTNSTKLSPVTDIWDLKLEFDGKISDYDEAAQEQADPTTGWAKQKAEGLNKASALVCKWGMRCHVKAHKDGNNTLEEVQNHRPYEIKALKDDEGLKLMQDMQKGLNDNIGQFTAQGLTAGIMLTIDGKISDYAAFIVNPGYAIKAKKTDTTAMEILMANADITLGDVVSLIDAEFFDTDPAFVVQMKYENRIDDLGHRFNSVEGEVKKEGVLAAGYVVGIAGTDKSAKTDLMGYYRIKGLHVGLATVELRNASGTVLQSKIIRVKRGVTLKIDWDVV
jgi:hypothetical protein